MSEHNQSEQTTPLQQLRRHAPKELFINRELSWLDFNQRVLEEARLTTHPLLERVKFLSIACSNLDEFIMIRVSGLQQQEQSGHGSEVSDDGAGPSEQLALLRTRISAMQETIDKLWKSDLSPALAGEGLRILDYSDLNADQVIQMRRYFEREVFPVLTPLAIDPGHPFPHISNLSMNLAIIVGDPVQGTRYARMKIPGTLPRLVPVEVDKPSAKSESVKNGDKPLASSGKSKGGNAARKHTATPEASFIWLEQVVAANLDTLFTGLEVINSFAFRVTRNADIEIQEDEASDLLRTIEEGIRQRHFGPVARLEYDDHMPAELRDLLVANLLANPSDAVGVHEALGLSDLMELLKVDRPELKDPPLVTRVPSELQTAVDEGRGDEMYAAIAQHDIFLHHPYDSFRPVITFIESAARDKAVQAIKQTLYRVGSRSPIVRALTQARDDDTQVAVLVELKARFDEENNIEWARALEDAGVHVVYGLLGLKTHCKMALVVRREAGGLKRYLHLGTGNYNPTTARIYTDFSLLTANEDLAADVSDLFNLLTGYSRQITYRKLLVAPVNMRERLLALIAHEAKCAKQGKPSRLLFKMNALVDREIIEALYSASQAGVPVDLIVRGTCCLRPGVKGMSETIQVVSVIGRFLEHSRAYYFHNGGSEAHVASHTARAKPTDEGDGDSKRTAKSSHEPVDALPMLYVGSADLMPRNLDRRVEILFPIEDADLRQTIFTEILELTLRDTAKAWHLHSDGSWRRVELGKRDEAAFSAQDHFLAVRRERANIAAAKIGDPTFTPASIYPPLPV